MLDLMHLKKDRTDTLVYNQLFETGTVIFLFIQKVHRMGILWLVLVYPSNTVISMIFLDSAFIFTAEIWAVIKAQEEIKDSVASKYISFTVSLSYFQVLHYMRAGTSLEWNGDTKVYLFKYCQ